MQGERLSWEISVLILLIGVLVVPRFFTQPTAVTRIAFGSCSSTGFAQPIWPAVLAAKPDVWIWAGDSIYADSLDINRFRNLYAEQRAKPLYRELMASTFITGTWDDHDYGANNAGKEYPLKSQTQQAFLDFLGVSQHDPRRTQEGVFVSHRFGPEGQRLNIILLDSRYHRDAPGPEGDLLGEAQWQWFANELQAEDTDLNIVVSSIAVIPNEPTDLEGWARFPKARQRLSSLLRKSNAPVVLLSGDRHVAEISRYEHPALAWPLYEVMSSGLTHAASGSHYNNPNRVGSLYTSLHYGLLEIEWESDRITVNMQIRDTDNRNRIADKLVIKR